MLARSSTIGRSTLLVFALSTTAAAQPALTRDAFVDRALSSGLAARLAEAEAVVEKAELAGAGRWLNPAAQWQREALPGGGAASSTQDFFLLSLPFVPSGRLGLEREAAALSAQAVDTRLQRVRAELRRDATIAFAHLLAARDRRLALDASLEKIRALARVIQARERAGEAAGMDRLRIEMEAAAVEDALRGSHLEALRSKAAALALLGPTADVPPAVEGELTAAMGNVEVDALVSDLEKRRSDLTALALEAQSAARAEDAAARGWIPEPSLTAGALVTQLGASESSTGYVVGLSVPLPIFDRRQSEEARAKARGDLARTRHAVLLHQALLGVRAALQAATLSRQRLEHHESEVLKRALDLRESAYAAYQGGSAELLVLVDAERTLRDALLHRVELGLAVAAAEADLLLIAGAWDAHAASSSSP